MGKWKFDLQLCAEDNAGADAGQNDNTDSAQTDTPGGDDTGANETPASDSMGVVVDPKTGRRTVELIAPKGDTAPGQEQEAAPLQETASQESPPQEIQPYTPQELIVAAQMGTVDESRVPDEFKLQYATYKQQLQQQAQQPTPEQPTQIPQQQPDPKTFYTSLADMALKNTLAELGMSKEDYEALSYNDDPKAKTMFDVAHQANIQRLVAQMQAAGYQEHARQSERKAIFDDIAAFIDNARQNEVNFAAIDDLMAERYKTLPYEQAEKIAQAINDMKQGTVTRSQLTILETYYKETREAYYAQKNGVSTTPTKRSAPKPPAVEPAGNGAKGQESIDFSRLRTMGRKEKGEFLGEYFKQRQQ